MQSIARPLLVSLFMITGATPAMAEVELMLKGVTSDAGRNVVELRVLNDDASATRWTLPAALAARVDVGGHQYDATLTPLPGQPEALSIPAHGFARARYAFTPPPGTEGRAVALSLPSASGMQQLSFTAPAAGATEVAAAAAPPPAMVPIEGNEVAANNAFLPNLSAYDPIYGIWGPNTDSEAKIQVSFKYQLFGAPQTDLTRTWSKGFFFAYTQRMLWDLRAESAPFRNIDFMPEIMYMTPALKTGENSYLTFRLAAKHQSNGRDGPDSRSLNMIYFQPAFAAEVLGNWHLTVEPRVWVFIGDKSQNPDVVHYWGNTGLKVGIGQEDGFRVVFDSKFNIGSGNGSFSTDLSYPVDRIFKTKLNAYLYAQLFTGYGEGILDYNRDLTRLRFGLAFVR